MKANRLRADVLAGLTTSFALLPECIAFALVAHLNPLMGLYGAFIICTLTALFGGRPGMVSGAAGSMAVVIVALVVQHGVQYLLATITTAIEPAAPDTMPGRPPNSAVRVQMMNAPYRPISGLR